MESITPKQKQKCVTDFFTNSRSRPSFSGKAGSSVGKSRLLSRDSITDKNLKNEAEWCDGDLTPALITPAKRKLSNSDGSAKADSASKRSKSTTKMTSAVKLASIRSRAMISFGPTVGKCDFAKTNTAAVSSTPNPEVGTSLSVTATPTTTVSSAAALNLQQIKDKLKGCKNLTNLKAHLAAINGCAEQVKQFKSMKVSVLSPVKASLSNLSPRRVHSPEKFSLSGLTAIPSPLRATTPSTPSKLKRSPYLANCIGSPDPKLKLACSRKLFDDDDVTSSSSSDKVTSESENAVIPAYKRMKSLAAVKHAESELPLPTKFKKLCDLFKRIDYFAWQYKKRQETCTFEKLKQRMELATHRSFDMSMFLKVITVLNREDKKWFILEQEIIGGKCQLTIMPNYPEHIKSIHSLNMLLEREKEFNRMLLETTKREHLKFLGSMKLTLTPLKTVYNWHPMFNLDTIEDVVPDMGLLPDEKKAKLTSNPNSILNYVIRRVPLSESGEVKPEENTLTPAKVENTPSVTPSSTLSSRLKGIPLHLLNKVREKEAATKARLMFRPPELDRELALLSRAPASIRIIERYFASTRAKSHPLVQIIKKLADSSKTTLAAAEKQLDYLLSLNLRADPTDLDKMWLSKSTFSNISYILASPDCRMSFLQEQIKIHVDKLSNS